LVPENLAQPASGWQSWPGSKALAATTPLRVQIRKVNRCGLYFSQSASSAVRRILYNDSPGFWLAPALLGVALILMGFLIVRFPELLAYAVAGIFVFLGIWLLGLAWQLRTRVTIRRLDEDDLLS
jgi:hypothetical protein